MKVFGIGLNKTGTSTLGLCFKALGAKHLSTRLDFLAQYRMGNLAPIFFETDRYDSFEDWPYPLMYRELYERYGRDAKFILTLRRSAEIWVDSLKAHSLTTNPVTHGRILAYGYAYPHGLEEEHMALYDAHTLAVRRFFEEQGAEDQLLQLCWETGDGWPELCRFLGAKPRSGPVPRANSREDRAAETSAALRVANQRNIDIQLKRLSEERAAQAT